LKPAVFSRPGPILAAVRLLMVGVAFLVVVTSEFPPAFRVWAWTALGAFAAVAVLFALSVRMRPSRRHRAILRVAGIVADGAVALAFMFVYAYQPAQPLRSIYLLPVIEAAMRFGVRGGLVASLVVMPFVVGQELLHSAYVNADPSWQGMAVRSMLGVLAGVAIGELRDELQRHRKEAEARAQEAEELRDRFRHRVDVLEAANRCARALASSLDLDGAFGAFLRELAGIVPYDRASVLLEDGELARVLIVAGAGESHVFPKGTTWPAERSVFRELRQTGRTMHRGDFSQPESDEEQALLELGLRTSVVAPLYAGGDLIGGLAVVRREPRSFQPEEIALLTLLARLVTHAVQNIRMYEAERRTVEELRRLSALRADFVSLVSHELRSPMAAVIGSAETLKARWRELQPGQRESFLTLIADETARLATLVGDVLDTSRIEAGTFSYRFADVDVGKLVEDTVATAAVGQEEVELQASVHGALPRVRGDRERLRQVLMNLIENAVKYSSAGDRVEVRAATVNGVVRVDVRDRGPGIARDQQGLIFEKFGRAAGPASHSGTGLGLFIARAIAEAHGGTLDVRSVPGEGATFTLTLPTFERGDG
jgi:signal transduction histidine kinase